MRLIFLPIKVRSAIRLTKLNLFGGALIVASLGSPARAAGACGPGPAPADGPIQATFAKGELACLCDQAIADVRAKVDRIVAVPKDDRNFQTTVFAFEDALTDFSLRTNPLSFARETTTDATTHDDAVACSDKLDRVGNELSTRRDLYLVLKDGAPVAGEPAFAEKNRLYVKQIQDFEKNGMSLSDADLARYADLKNQVSALETAYADALAKDHPTITLQEAETKGLSKVFLDRVRTPSGEYAIEVNEPNLTEITSKADDPNVRKRFSIAFTNLGGEDNVRRLNQAVELRAQIAKLLGRPTYADYKIEGRMAGSASTVDAFLEKIGASLKPKARDDLKILLDYKKTIDPGATELFPWDVAHLGYLIRRDKLKVDEDRVREYFPLDRVMSGLFEVYSTLLSVDFREVAGVRGWADAVKLYEIRDRRGSGSPLIGYFYVDLAPRPLKYNHAAAFTLVSGRRLANGEYNKPVSAIVGNVSPAGGGKPALLKHDEVVTVFHEFGHIMHETLTRAPYASLSGAQVARDFVEAPSQMLENWVWQPEILNKLSGHYLDPSKKLPKDLLDQLVAARDFLRGRAYAGQQVLARFDMSLHEIQPGAKLDADGLYRKLVTDMMGMSPIAGTHFSGSFGHLMGGYEAGYYGYLWSDVYASDMFTAFEGHLLDPAMGARYRTEILEKGDMQDAGEIVRNFLGREPNDRAFLKKLGI